MQRNYKPISIRKRKKLLAALSPLLIAALVACGDVTGEITKADVAQQSAPRFDYSLSIDISAEANRAEIEAQYGGTAVVWRPEAGFAVLGLNNTGELHTLGKKKNKKAFKSPEVAEGSVDGNGRSSWAGGRSSWAGGEPTTFTENVNYWDQIDLPEGQAVATRLGAGVKVAVIDTGIDLNHPAFAGKLAPNYEWKDFVDGDNYPQEVGGPNYGHGTGVADIIVQVAPNVTILPIRVLGPDGAGDTTDVVAAIDYAVQRGADIINLSLGTEGEEKALKEVVKYARKQDVLIVASAGNDPRKEILYPAMQRGEVLGIGSINRYDEISTFSAHGKNLSLMAPGEQIYTAAPGQSVSYWSGTSFAAPIVSGAVALALGEPDVKVKDVAKKIAEEGYDVRSRGRNSYYEKDDISNRLDIDAFLMKVLK